MLFLRTIVKTPNEKLLDHTDQVTSTIFINEDKGVQYRFTISEFRGKNYIGVREWYVDFEGEWAPSNNGFTMPYELHTSARLFGALAEVLSDAEVLKDVLESSDVNILDTAR